MPILRFIMYWGLCSCGAGRASPFLLEVHGLVGYPRAASLIDYVGRIMTRVFLPVIARRVTGVRVINTALKDQLMRWKVPEEKIAVVPSFYCDRSVWHPMHPSDQAV
jgi:hypothetical protein